MSNQSVLTTNQQLIRIDWAREDNIPENDTNGHIRETVGNYSQRDTNLVLTKLGQLPLFS